MAARWSIVLLTRAAEKDLTAGHLSVSAQLAGPLLPNWQGESPPPLSPGHERVRGIEWTSISQTLWILKGVGRTAPVNCTLPVKVGPPPPPEEKERGHTIRLDAKLNISTAMPQQLFTLNDHWAEQNPFYPSEKTNLVQWFSVGFASGLYITMDIKWDKKNCKK